MTSKLLWMDIGWPLPVEGQGIDQRWVQSFAATRLADILARLAIGDHLLNLPPMDRAFFHTLAEQTITRAVEQYAHFTDEEGDAEPRPRPRQRLPIPPT